MSLLEHTEPEIKKIEGIEKRATKMVIELRAMECEERVGGPGILTTLETRRKRGDLKYLMAFLSHFFMGLI